MHGGSLEQQAGELSAVGYVWRFMANFMQCIPDTSLRPDLRHGGERVGRSLRAVALLAWSLGAVILGVSGCAVEGDDELFSRIDAGNIDASACSEAVEFVEVVAILSASCAAIPSCHGEESGIGLVLTETTAFDRLVGQPSTQSDKALVEAGDASESWVVDKLLARNGATLMPPQGPLAEEDVQRLACWIEQGANP